MSTPATIDEVCAVAMAEAFRGDGERLHRELARREAAAAAANDRQKPTTWISPFWAAM